MALTIKYSVVISGDYKSISITDNGTAWGVGGEPDTGDVTGVTLNLYTGSDTSTATHAITFTAGEITTFTSGGTVTILSTDSRWFALPYFPDGFYQTKLVVSVSTGTSIATFQAFSSTFYIRKYIYKEIASISLPMTTYFEPNAKITGGLASVFILDELEKSITPSRAIEWTKIYNFLIWNFNA